MRYALYDGRVQIISDDTPIEQLTGKPVKHYRKTCTECHDGYRKDCLSWDHYGVNTAATRNCDAGIKACKDHRCYYVNNWDSGTRS